MTFVKLSYQVRVLDASPSQPTILNIASAIDDASPPDRFSTAARADLWLLRTFFPLVGRYAAPRNIPFGIATFPWWGIRYMVYPILIFD
jgi:hypothetical protein